jgi:hypothetical protein
MLAGVLRVYMQLIPGLSPWDPGGVHMQTVVRVAPIVRESPK